MRNEGRFTKDTFAVAMHLINGVLEGKELPATLPPTLVPPSMRLPASPFPNAAFPAAQSSFALQQNAQYTGFGIPQPQTASAMSEAHRDLLSLDDTPVEPTSPPPVATLSPHVTGAYNSQIQASSVPSNFVPQSRSFGRDLLDDEEAEGRQMKQINDNNMDIANVRNQVNSTQAAQANAERDRGNLESEVANSAATLSQLQTQLASAKIGYETETRLLEALRERYTAQAREIKEVREELISAESELSAVRLEKTEVGGALLREKDDVRGLKKRLAEVLEETTNVKKEVEAAKKEVRLQRGLLVIAKKQLSTAEGELEEAKKHVQDSLAERDEAVVDVKHAEDSAAALKEEISKITTSPKQNGTVPFAAAAAATAFSPGSATGTPRSGTPRGTGSPAMTSPALPFADASTVTSPAPSNFTPGAGRSGNPFDRLRGASVSSDTSTPMRSASPFAVPVGEVTSPITAQGSRPTSAAGHMASPVDEDDPFGFNETPAITTVAAESPKPTSVEAPQKKDTNLLDTVASPTQEHLISPADTSFFTPISSSAGANILDGFINEEKNLETQRLKDTEAEENNLPHPATKFPHLTADLTSIHNIDKQRGEGSDFKSPDTSNIDLDLPPLQEIVEKDETDSEDEDEKPLGKVKEERQAAAALSGPSTETPSLPATRSPEPTSFEDAFGFSATGTDAPVATAPATATTTAPSSHFSTLGSEMFLSSPATSTAVHPGVNGHGPGQSLTLYFTIRCPDAILETSAISAFDEAFGTLPSTSNAKPATSNEPFKFDNFDETFDFGNTSLHARTASNEAASPANAAPAALAPTSAPAPAAAAFDDAFGVPNAFPASSAPKLAPIPTAPLSFDDAFEVSTNERQVPKSVSFAPPESPTSTQQTHDAAPNGANSVRSLSPGAARGSSSSSGRPTSPNQTSASKLPAATPRPPKENAAARPGSKYETDGAGPSRSRLSLHFPFGRSKSSKEKKEKEKDKKEKDKHAKDHGHATGGVMPPVPAIPRSYGVINEQDETANFGTPGEDGDLPALKQLLELGFPREQAIEALENSGYSFQRALNKLVGQSA